jgi:hypothetical protein
MDHGWRHTHAVCAVPLRKSPDRLRGFGRAEHAVTEVAAIHWFHGARCFNEDISLKAGAKPFFQSETILKHRFNKIWFLRLSRRESLEPKPSTTPINKVSAYFCIHHKKAFF